MESEGTGIVSGGRAKAAALTLTACFIISFLCITIVSKTSFLYSFHDGADINWFLTMGRGIVNGKVPYKDLFEQKGVLLYMLFALNYLMCGNSFYFIYAVQVVCFAAFLYLSYKIISLYQAAKYAWLGTIATALVVCCSNAYFSGGGEVEEYCLPMVTYGLYVFLRYVKRGGDGLPLKQAALCGVFAGCIFWMKYTMLVFYAAFAVCMFADRCVKKDVKSGFAFIGVFAAAFAAVSLPWLVYLGVNGAIGDMLQVYIINNIFGYAGGGSAGQLLSGVGEALKKVLRNFFLYIFAVNAAFYFCKGVNGAAKRYKIYFVCMQCMLFVVQCLIKGGIGYYHLIMGAFVPLGVAGALYSLSCLWALVKCARLRLKAKRQGEEYEPYSKLRKGACGRIRRCCGIAGSRLKVGANAHTLVLCFIVIVYVCMFFGNCTLALFYPEQSYAQVALAEEISSEREEEGGKPLYLLCYKIHDQGFYAACDETPEFYYFAMNNFEYEAFPEMYDEAEGYVVNGEAKYVVTEFDTWEEEQNTCLAKYVFAKDLSYYHVENNTKIEYMQFCLLKLK